MDTIKFEKVACIICESSDLHQVSNIGQFGIPTNTCICKKCGLSFLSPRWTAEKYLDFYKNEYDKYYRPNVIKKDYSKSPEKDPFSYYPILKRLTDRNLITQNTEKLLDIGSGSGQKLEIFNSSKPIKQLYAIEPSKHCFEQLQSRGIQVITDDISSDWEKNYESTFDLITMRHVLEHFMNPLEVLQKLRSVLSPNGLIYIAIPNSFILENRQLFKSYFRVVHTYYFNKFSIENLVHKAGYEIIALEEGDEMHGLEIFLVIKPSNSPIPVKIDSTVYDRQKATYDKKIKEEQSITFQVKQFMAEQWQFISRLKKSIFPKPIKW